MKKILIVTNHMKVGGIQKSLLELLKSLAKCDEYQVSLFCCKKTGAFIDQIPAKIKILQENPYAITTEQALSDCKKQGTRYYIFRMIASLWSKCFTKSLPAHVLCRRIGVLDGEYDIAISYSQPIADHEFCNLTNEIVLNCVCAKRKITFVHCDFGSYGGNTKRNRKLYKRFDSIAAVSDSVGRRFSEIIPEVSDKVYTVYNFCDCAEIEQLAQQDSVVYMTKTLVTVARLSEEKGILRCIPIFNKLFREGYSFEWHIVGGGPQKNAIEKKIEECDLGQTVILEGEQLNPYRYLKNADYLLVPSFHEAAPMVFDEAFTLGVPVLTTNTLSAKELIEKRQIGLVCENNDEAIYNMIKQALSDDTRFTIDGSPESDICMKQFQLICN